MDFFNDERVKIFWEGFKAILLVVIIGLLIYLTYFVKNSLVEIENQDNSLVAINSSSDEVINNEEEIIEATIKVDLKGAVTNPGVYELKTGSVVNDLINLGGGVKKGVSLKNINLSKKLSDEMVVYVYTDSELKKIAVSSTVVEECVCETEEITSCEGSSIIITGENSNTSSDNNTSDQGEEVKKVSINTAELAELMTLSGIGESKAKAIIEYRTNNGKFNNIEEIKNVSGIGDSVYQKIKDDITI